MRTQSHKLHFVTYVTRYPLSPMQWSQVTSVITAWRLVFLNEILISSPEAKHGQVLFINQEENVLENMNYDQQA